jgi:RimJ/RimL family protein N-acetyltransferase
MLADVQVRFHDDVDEFAAVAVPLLQRDPVLHTVELTLLRGGALIAGEALLLLTVWEDGVAVGAALQTRPQGLLGTGLTIACVPAVVDALAVERSDLAGFRGVRDTADEFVTQWRSRTGATVAGREEDRLYRLGEPHWPRVHGAARPATDADHELLVHWLCGFAEEAFLDDPDPSVAEASIAAAASAGDVYQLWTVDAAPVSVAGVRRPASGVARIGPVYTPKQLRGNGFGSAATAAGVRWAHSVGAEDVVLFADLDNPVSNAIYQRMGFEPVADTLRVAFTARPVGGCA